MVRFKIVRFRHYRQAQELMNKEDATEEEHFAFVISLVDAWDFKDVETDKALPVGMESMDELTIKQFNEAMELFNQEMGFVTTVPKANAGPSSSTSSPSNKAETPETDPTG